MRDDILIREVEQNDIDRLIILIKQLGYELTNDDLQDIINHYIDTPNYFAFVAEKSGIIIAIAGLFIFKYLHIKGDIAHLSSFVVDEDYRNQKVGEQILKYIENHAVSQGCVKIQLTSGFHRKDSGTHRFYLNHGYKIDVAQYFVKELC